MEERKRDYQIKTPRSKKDSRDHKIHGSDKKISQQPTNKAVMWETSATTKPEMVAQLVSEMRALKMKTEEQSLKNSPKTQTPESQQAKRDRQS